MQPYRIVKYRGYPFSEHFLAHAFKVWEDRFCVKLRSTRVSRDHRFAGRDRVICLPSVTVTGKQPLRNMYQRIHNAGERYFCIRAFKCISSPDRTTKYVPIPWNSTLTVYILLSCVTSFCWGSFDTCLENFYPKSHWLVLFGYEGCSVQLTAKKHECEQMIHT